MKRSEKAGFPRGIVFLALALILVLSACGALAEATLKLPSDIKEIAEMTFFSDTSLDRVVLPKGIRKIGGKAFAESSVKTVNLPESLEEIADDAFDPGVTMTAVKGSYAYEWAVENGFIPGDFEFTDNGDGTCTLSRYTGESSNPDNIIIPRRWGMLKVTEIGSDNKSILTDICNGTVITAIGNPVGMFYGYKTDGVLTTASQAQAANLGYLDNKGNKIAYKAGDMKFADQNNDGIISEADRVVIGDPNPDIYGNIYTRLNWKNWTLDAAFTYSVGNDIYNYERSVLESGKYFYNQTTAMNNRWTTEGQVTDIPRVSYRDPQGNASFSDRWIEDGSYLRLSNVTINYTLPISSTYLQGITVWGAAYNLFTLTHYLGSNPDCSFSSNILYQGIDCGLLGSGRSFAMGVKINL